MSAVARAQPKKQLASLWYGPFKILEVINGDSVKLELPGGYRAYNVFHVSALKPYHGDTSAVRVQEPPQPMIDSDGIERFYVKSITSHKKERGQFYFRVKWLGYDASYDSWEPEFNLKLDGTNEDIEPLRRYKQRHGL